MSGHAIFAVNKFSFSSDFVVEIKSHPDLQIEIPGLQNGHFFHLPTAAGLQLGRPVPKGKTEAENDVFGTIQQLTYHAGTGSGLYVSRRQDDLR